MTTTSRTFILASLALATSCLVAAHDHGGGMDMSMDGMALPIGKMLTYLHFTSGDNVLFLGWVPKSAGAMVGTCIGLFLLAVVERWIAACRAMMVLHWDKRAQILLSDRVNRLPSSSQPNTKTTPSIWDEVLLRTAPPFIPSHDIVRGLIQIGQSAISVAFMLVAMTFQASFILSIAFGAGFGEMLFGRYINHEAHLS